MSTFAIKLHSLSLLVAGLLVGAACAPGGGGQAAPEALALSLEVAPGGLVPAFSPEVRDYELTSYSTLSKVLLTVRGGTARIVGADASFQDGVAAPLPTMMIRPDAVIPIEVATAMGPVTYTLHLLPKDLPPFTFRDYGATPGNLYVAPYSPTKPFTPYLLIVSTSGRIVYYRRLEKPGFDWKRSTLTTGETRYTYISDGDLHVLDEDFQLLGQYRLRSTAQHTSYAADLHDVKMFEDDHFILQSYVERMVTNVPAELLPAAGGARVIAAVLQEQRGSQVVFEWDSTTHPELYALSTESNNYASTEKAADYAHLNSITIDPRDGNFVLSFRHLDSILKVSRRDGAILWRLGNQGDSFATTDAQKTSHQHDARLLPDGRLQAFDNGNQSGNSRIVRYGLDVESGRLTSFESLPLGYYTHAMGNIDVLDARRVVVGLGAHSPGAPDLEELDLLSGQPAFELSFAYDYYSYRAYKTE